MKVLGLLGILLGCGVGFFVLMLLLDVLLAWLGLDMNSVAQSYRSRSSQVLSTTPVVAGKTELRSPSHLKKLKRMFTTIRNKRKGK